MGFLSAERGGCMHAQTIRCCAVEWVCGKNRLLPLSSQLVFACMYVIEFNNTFLICNYCTCSVSALQWLPWLHPIAPALCTIPISLSTSLCRFSVSAIQAFRLSLLPMLACHLVPNTTTEEGSIDSVEELSRGSRVSSEDSTEGTGRAELCLESDTSCEDSSSDQGCAGEWRRIAPNPLFQRATGRDHLRQTSLMGQQGSVGIGPAPEGRILSLLINDMAQRELPSLSIATKQLANDNVSQSGGPSDGVVLLYRTATDGVTWVLGDVQQRMPPSGKPLQWGVWTE